MKSNDSTDRKIIKCSHRPHSFLSGLNNAPMFFQVVMQLRLNHILTSAFLVENIYSNIISCCTLWYQLTSSLLDNFSFEKEKKRNFKTLMYTE